MSSTYRAFVSVVQAAAFLGAGALGYRALTQDVWWLCQSGTCTLDNNGRMITGAVAALLLVAGLVSAQRLAQASRVEPEASAGPGPSR